MKITAFVVARLTSTRLPQKHLKLIGNKPMLKWITDRLKKSKFINNIVLTTLNEPESVKLQQFATTENIDCFLFDGDVDDVVGRLVSASKHYKSDICILISGDCPLIYIETLDRMIKALMESDKLCAGIDGKGRGKVIHEGMGCVCKREAWILADKMSDKPELREHHFPVIHKNPNVFEKVLVGEEDVFFQLDHRISVDTPADLKFMNVIYEKLALENKEFNLKNAVVLLLKNRDILKINSDVKQKGLFDKSKKFLFSVTAGDNFGFGNLFRSLHLADKLTRLGHGADFVVLDNFACEIVLKNGFNCFKLNDFGKDIWRNYHKVIFDINSNVNIENKIPKNSIVIDNIQPFTKNADKTIIPTTYFNNSDNRTNILSGYLIVRDSVKKLKEKKTEKEFDALFYKTEPFKHGKLKSIKVVKQFDNDFLELLAKSKFYFAPFGYSFYEAIYLNTIPVMTDNLEEGNKFYKSLNLSTLTKDNFFQVDLPKLKDHTKEILDIILE